MFSIFLRIQYVTRSSTAYQSRALVVFATILNREQSSISPSDEYLQLPRSQSV